MKMLDHALGFVARGWAVFPLKPGEKVPMTGHGHRDAVTDIVKVRATWTGTPNANIGIATGDISGISVIDIDGDNGIASAKQLTGQFPETLTIKTPHGYHLYYSYHPDLHTGAAFMPGIDVRSGEAALNTGGYVVAAGSVVGGVLYKVVKDLPVATLPVVPDVFKLRSRVPITAQGPRFDTASALAGVPEGQRDQTIFKLAARLRQANVPEDAAIRLVQEAAGNCQPPFDQAIAMSKVQQVYRRYEAGQDRQIQAIAAKLQIENAPKHTEDTGVHLFTWDAPMPMVFQIDHLYEEKDGLHAEIFISVTPLEGKPWVAGPLRFNLSTPTGQSTVTRALSSRDKAVEWTGFVDAVARLMIQLYRQGHPPMDMTDLASLVMPEWAMYPFLMRGSQTNMYGDPGSGKGYIVLAIALAFAGLYNPLGWQIPEFGNVLYLDWEDNGNECAARLRRLLGEQFDNPFTNQERFLYRRMSGRLETQVDGIKQIVRERNIKLVIIDSIGYACGGDLTDAEVAIRFSDLLHQMGNVTTLCIGHTPQQAGRDGPRQEFGSQFFRAGTRNAWEVRANQEEGQHTMYQALYHRKSNTGMKQRTIGVKLDFDPDHDLAEWVKLYATTIDNNPTQLDGSSARIRIQAALLQGPMTQAEIIAVTGTSLGATKTELSRGVRDGRYLIVDPEAKKPVYKLAPSESE